MKDPAGMMICSAADTCKVKCDAKVPHERVHVLCGRATCRSSNGVPGAICVPVSEYMKDKTGGKQHG